MENPPWQTALTTHVNIKIKELEHSREYQIVDQYTESRPTESEKVQEIKYEAVSLGTEDFIVDNDSEQTPSPKVKELKEYLNGIRNYLPEE